MERKFTLAFRARSVDRQPQFAYDLAISFHLPARFKVSQNMRSPEFFRKLDYLPTGWAIVLGSGAGLLIVSGLALRLSPLTAALLSLPAIGIAAALAFSGRPVALEVPSPPVKEHSDEKTEYAPVGDGRYVTPLVPLVDISAGSFRMGSPEGEPGRYDNEGPVHEVTVSPFRCMQTPVTRRVYKEVMGVDPGWPEGEADERPVNNVNWFEALRFCNRLSERERLKPCYRFRDETTPIRDGEADGYRLPTEAEWEYACRAGTDAPWSFGDNEAELGRYAWYEKNSGDVPHTVGELEPNAWGLHDMHGNGREWCWD